MRKKSDFMKWTRRIYHLEDEEIKPSECEGFLHKARKPRGDCCACLKPILPGQEYIKFNSYTMADFRIHKNCYIEDRGRCVLGVKTRKIYDIYHRLRSHVFCKEFVVDKKQ